MTNKKLFKYPNVASLKNRVNNLQDALDLVGVSYETAVANGKNNVPSSWRIDCGCFLEYRDASGLEAAHPSFGISSFYFINKENPDVNSRQVCEIQTTPKGNFKSVGNQPACENWFVADERNVFIWNDKRYYKAGLFEQLKTEGFEFEEVNFATEAPEAPEAPEATVVCIPTLKELETQFATEEAFLEYFGITVEEAKKNAESRKPNAWSCEESRHYIFRGEGKREATNPKAGISDICFGTSGKFRLAYNTPGSLIQYVGPTCKYETGAEEEYYDGMLEVSREKYVDACKKAYEKSLNGPVVCVEQFERKKEELKTIKVRFWSDVPSDFTGIATETRDGDTLRFLNGLRHREDGPAFEATSGAKAWWLNDKRHREDGPAIEWADGTKEWWLNDNNYSEENWRKEVTKLGIKEKKPIEVNVFENPETAIPALFKTFSDTTKLLGVSRDEVLANHARKDRSECWGLEEAQGILTWYNKNGKEEIHPEYGISFLTFDDFRSEDSDNKLMVFGVSDYSGGTTHKGTYSVEFEADGISIFTKTKSHSTFLKEIVELGEYKVNTKKGVIRRFVDPSVDVPALFGTLEAVLKYLGLSEETALNNHLDKVPGSWRLEESSNDYCCLSWFGADGLAEPSQEFGINFFNFHDGDLRSFGVCDRGETIRDKDTFMYDIVGDLFKIHKYRNGNSSYENWVTLMSKQYCVAPFVEPILNAEEEEEIVEEIDENEDEECQEIQTIQLLEDPVAQIPSAFSTLKDAHEQLDGKGWRFDKQGGDTLVTWNLANGDETINPDLGLSYFHYNSRGELESFGVADKDGEIDGDSTFQFRWYAPSEEYILDSKYGNPSYSNWVALVKTWNDFHVKGFVTGSLVKPKQTVKEPSVETVVETVIVAAAVAAPSLTEKIKQVAVSDAKQVAVRISVEQLAKVVQVLVCELLTAQTKGAKKATVVTKLNEFFSTEKGRAFIKFFVGCSAPMLKEHLPEKYHTVLETVAAEARIQGEVTAIMSVASMMEPVVSILGANMYSSLFGGTNTEKIRVNVAAPATTNHDEEAVSESVSLSVASNVSR